MGYYPLLLLNVNGSPVEKSPKNIKKEAPAK
jgi:hypothetical protein